jgi:hypothetical protein
LAVNELSTGRIERYLSSDLASDIVKSVILKINDDILRCKSKKPLQALEGIAAACQ